MTSNDLPNENVCTMAICYKLKARNPVNTVASKKEETIKWIGSKIISSPPHILYSFCYVSTSRRFYLLSNSGGMCLKEEDLTPTHPGAVGEGVTIFLPPPPVPWVGKASFSKFWLHLGTNIVYEIYRMSIKVCYLFKQHTCVELKVTPFLEKTFLSWYNTFQIILVKWFCDFLNMKKIFNLENGR